MHQGPLKVGHKEKQVLDTCLRTKNTRAGCMASTSNALQHGNTAPTAGYTRTAPTEITLSSTAFYVDCAAKRTQKRKYGQHPISPTMTERANTGAQNKPPRTYLRPDPNSRRMLHGLCTLLGSIAVISIFCCCRRLLISEELLCPCVGLEGSRLLPLGVVAPSQVRPVRPGRRASSDRLKTNKIEGRYCPCRRHVHGKRNQR